MPTGDLQWYFFCTCGREYPTGSRTNRSNQAGHWKATGKDRKVVYNSRTVGMKRTLVFHAGKGRKEKRTDWVMHEYRLVESEIPNAGVRLVCFFAVFVLVSLSLFYEMGFLLQTHLFALD